MGNQFKKKKKEREKASKEGRKRKEKRKGCELKKTNFREEAAAEFRQPCWGWAGDGLNWYPKVWCQSHSEWPGCWEGTAK